MEDRRLLTAYLFIQDQAYVTEGQSIQVPVSIYVPSSTPMTVNWHFQNLTAQRSYDYDLPGRPPLPQMSFCTEVPGMEPPDYIPTGGFTIPIDALPDNLYEGDEQFLIVLDEGAGYEIRHPNPLQDGGAALVAVRDAPVIVGIASVSDGSEDLLDVNDPPAGTKPVQFLVSRSGGDRTQELTVQYQVAGINPAPTSSGDYSASGTVTIPADADSAILKIVPTDDTQIEAAWENLRVTLVADGATYVLGANTFADGRIQDNDFRIVAAEVGFDSQGVKRDGGTQALYETPQWLDSNGDGDADDTDERHFPLSYARSTPVAGGDRFVTATPKFWIEGNLTSPTYTIQGFGSDPSGGIFQNPGQLVTNADGTRTLSAATTCNTRLPQTIDKGDLGIAWRIIPSNRPDKPVIYGNSANRIYVTGVAVSNRLETVLDIGCRNAKGKAPDTPFGHAEVTQAIWSDFENPMPGVLRADGTEMKYWGATASQNYPDPARQDENFTAAGLVKHADGRCEAWAELLVAVWAAQGIEGEVWRAVPDATAIDLPVGSTLEGFIVDALPGQGNAGPESAFVDHAVVRLRSPSGVYDAVFDPSYGRLYDTEQAWIDGSVDEFVYHTLGGTQGRVSHEDGTDDFIFSPR